MNTKPPSRRSPYRAGRKPYAGASRANDGLDDADDLALTDAGLRLDAREALGPMFTDRRGAASLLQEEGE